MIAELPRDPIVRFLSSTLAREFKPWRSSDGACPQGQFIRGAATNRIRIYRGANRSGKTTVLGADTALRLQGWHPCARQRGPVHGWLVGVDWEQGIGGVLWPAVKRWLDPRNVKSISYMRRSDPEIPIAVSFHNGSLLEFKSADSELRKFAGAKLHFAGMDEEMERDYVNEVRARLVDLGGDLALTLTPVSRKLWVRDLEREPGTLLIRASIYQILSAGILDKQTADSWLATLGSRELAIRAYGDFGSAEGLVYPEFDRDIHVVQPRGTELVNGNGEVVAPWPLPKHWPRVAAMDFGYAAPAAVCVAARGEGKLFVERCYYAAGVKTDTWGKLLKEALPPYRDADEAATSGDGRGRLARPVACDHDAGDRALLEAAGVPTEPARKDIEPGIAAVTRRLVSRTLYLIVQDAKPPIHPVVGRCDAHSLAWELDGYAYPEQPEGRPTVRDLPLKANDHAADCGRYLIMAEDLTSEMPNLPKFKPSSELAGLGFRAPPGF